MKLFTIHDNKAETFLPPISFRNKGEAIRAFETTVRDPKTQFHAYPADYTLIQIGSYNVDSGIIEPETHTILIHGHEFELN